MRVGPQVCGSTLIRVGLENQPTNSKWGGPTRSAFCRPSAGRTGTGQPALSPLEIIQD